MHEKHHRGHAHFSANSVNFAISQTAKLGGRDGSESTSLLGTSGSHTRRHSDYNSLRHAQGRNSAKWAVGPSDKGAGKAAVPDDYAYQHRAVLTRIRSHKSAAAAAAGRVAGRVGEGGAAREVQNLWGIMTFSEKYVSEMYNVGALLPSWLFFCVFLFLRLSVFNLWFFVTVLATCCNIAYSFLALTSDGFSPPSLSLSIFAPLLSLHPSAGLFFAQARCTCAAWAASSPGWVFWSSLKGRRPSMSSSRPSASDFSRRVVDC